MSVVDEFLTRVQSHKGVSGVIILNNDGIPIKSTLKEDETIQYCSLFHHLIYKTKMAVQELDSTNELTLIRIRSRKNEIMIAPEHDFIFIVIQEAET